MKLNVFFEEATYKAAHIHKTCKYILKMLARFTPAERF